MGRFEPDLTPADNLAVLWPKSPCNVHALVVPVRTHEEWNAGGERNRTESRGWGGGVMRVLVGGRMEQAQEEGKSL